MTSRVIISGAPGWVGRSAVDYIGDAPDVVLAARSPRDIMVAGRPRETVAMETLTMLDRGVPTTMVHAGFPTQDQVEAASERVYVDATTRLRMTVIDIISALAPMDIVYLSSGAATAVERGLRIANRGRVYGRAKLDDEAALTMATAGTGGRLCIVRAFALSGPYMTKPETYALGNMIFQALDTGAIEVKAAHPVRRSYMAIDDMLRIAMSAVGELEAGQSITFETAGEAVEMGDLASRVLGVLGYEPTAVTRPAFDPDVAPDDYLGDPALVGELAARAGVVPASLDQQIAVTAEWLRENRNS